MGPVARCDYATTAARVLIDESALNGASPRELLQAYEAILGELRRQGVSRTSDAPIGQYAEWLAARVLNANLAANAMKSYDLDSPEYGRVQVKARLKRTTATKSQLQLSPFRSFDFDHALVIVFDDTIGVTSATVLPVAVIEANGVHRAHVNGLVLSATPKLLAQGIDITRRFVEPKSLTNEEFHSLTSAGHLKWEEYDRSARYQCRACGQIALAEDNETLFDGLLDVRCPGCDCILLVVDYPIRS